MYIYFSVLILAVPGCKFNNQVSPSRSLFYSIREQGDHGRIQKMVEPYKKQLDAEMKVVIGSSEVELPKQTGMPETLLGNFVADLVLEYGRKIDHETDFAVLNNGGLRSSLPKGDITIGNVYELMPFDNELVIVTMQGDVLLELFGYIASRGGVPLAGLNMKIVKMNGNPVATGILIRNMPFDPGKTYKMITSDYLANGGDSMGFLSTGLIQPTSKKLRDAIIDHIRLQTANQIKIHPVMDGRISLEN